METAMTINQNQNSFVIEFWNWMLLCIKVAAAAAGKVEIFLTLSSIIKPIMSMDRLMMPLQVETVIIAHCYYYHLLHSVSSENPEIQLHFKTWISEPNAHNFPLCKKGCKKTLPRSNSNIACLFQASMSNDQDLLPKCLKSRLKVSSLSWCRRSHLKNLPLNSFAKKKLLNTQQQLWSNFKILQVYQTETFFLSLVTLLLDKTWYERKRSFNIFCSVKYED